MKENDENAWPGINFKNLFTIFTSYFNTKSRNTKNQFNFKCHQFVFLAAIILKTKPATREIIECRIFIIVRLFVKCKLKFFFCFSDLDKHNFYATPEVTSWHLYRIASGFHKKTQSHGQTYMRIFDRRNFDIDCKLTGLLDY